jgi:hypothetical protein
VKIKKCHFARNEAVNFFSHLSLTKKGRRLRRG